MTLVVSMRFRTRAGARRRDFKTRAGARRRDFKTLAAVGMRLANASRCACVALSIIYLFTLFQKSTASFQLLLVSVSFRGPMRCMRRFVDIILTEMTGTAARAPARRFSPRASILLLIIIITIIITIPSSSYHHHHHRHHHHHHHTVIVILSLYYDARYHCITMPGRASSCR